jgi:C4-dicarboxylate transporter DctM subunit
MGIPIAFILGLAPSIAIIGKGIPIAVITQKMFTSTDSFVLMAVPLFILAGNLMAEGGITRRLINFSKVVVGFISGGLALVTVLTSMGVAAITGSAVATAAAVGSIMIPAMVKNGYKKDFASAVVAASSIMGPIIPPSIPFILYGVLANVSIASLFLGGIIPGILLGVSMFIIIIIFARIHNFPREKFPSFIEFLKSFIKAVPPLGMPVLVLGGILTGIFTPTEAAVIAVAYSFILGLIYRELKLSTLTKIFSESASTSSVVMLIIATSSIFGWFLAAEQIPQQVTNFFLSITNNPYLILLMINGLLLFVGTFMETTASIVILTPVLLPLVTSLGISPLHFGVVMAVNLVIGMVTPPLGVSLYVSCAMGKVTLEEITKRVWPFVLSSIVVLMLITYIPWLVTFIPTILSK